VVYAQAGDKVNAIALFKNILKTQPDYKPAADALRQLELMQVGNS
jgi:hypothetical protein